RVVAEDRHRGRVADEDDVDSSLVREATTGRVVGGDHRDRLAPPLHLGQLGERELAGGRGCGRRLLRADAHFESPSRATLSMRRTEPTRTAPARTGGSNSATS